MPPQESAAIPAAPRKTLLEWIETDDGDKTSTQPDGTPQAQAFHARIFIAPGDGSGNPAERIQPPAGLQLAPLG